MVTSSNFGARIKSERDEFAASSPTVTTPQPKNSGTLCREVRALKEGVRRYGEGRWKEIHDEYQTIVAYLTGSLTDDLSCHPYRWLGPRTPRFFT